MGHSYKGMSYSYKGSEFFIHEKITHTCMNNSLFEGNLWVRGEHFGSETLSPPGITCFVVCFCFLGEMGK